MLFFPEILQTMIVALMIAVPTCAIYQRAGFNPIWAVMLLIPVFGLLLVFLHLALFPWHQRNKKIGE
jgi:uncharacterized membrane protein YhaH (DUF805 family)